MDKTKEQIEEMLQLRHKRHRKHIHPVLEGIPSGNPYVDALYEAPPEMEPVGEPPAPPELPPDEAPGLGEPEVTGDGQDARVELRPATARGEHEKKKIALFNTLTEVLDDGKIERTEAAIRTFIDTHREELGTLIELENEVLDLMVKNSDIYRDTQASAGKEEEPGETQTSARRGQPETVPITPPEGVTSSVQKILQGDSVKEVLEQMTINQGGTAIKVSFEKKDERLIAKGALLQYEGVVSVDDIDDGLVVFTTDSTPEAAEERISKILSGARIGLAAEIPEAPAALPTEAPTAGIAPEAPPAEMPPDEFEMEGYTEVYDRDKLSEVKIRSATPATWFVRVEALSNRERTSVIKVARDKVGEESYNVVPKGVDLLVTAGDEQSAIATVKDWLKEGDVYLSEVSVEATGPYTEFFTDRGASPAPDYIVPVAHGTAGSDDSDVGTAPMNTDNLGAPEDAVPDNELGVPAPVYKMDIPEDPDQESKLGDVLNKAKEVGILKSWVKIVAKEVPPEEGPPEEMPPEESVKEQDDIPPEEMPPEAPPDEAPPEEPTDYIAIEFSDDVEAEERENFPEWIEAETGAEDPAEAVLVDNYEPSTEETLEEPEEGLPEVPPEEIPPEIPEESGAKK